MGVAVLNPQDCLRHPLAHMKYPRNPSACPNRQKNRTRRSPPRNQTARSPPVAPPLPPPRDAVSTLVPKVPVNREKSPNNKIVVGQVRILKRGEEIPKKISDLVVENTDLEFIRQIRPDPVVPKTQIRVSSRKSQPAPFYAGPATMTSPPPSDVPLPVFFTKKSVSLFQAVDATNDLIRILRLDIA